MNVSIFGLGYVGCVTAACLAKDGHSVVGVDVNPQKVEAINAGRSPLVEPGLEVLVREMVGVRRLSACSDAGKAVAATDLSLVCVGSPSSENGSLDLKYVRSVCREIGCALKAKQQYHVVVIRSTVLPGTVEEKLIPVLEESSGLKAGKDFGVCMNPEFLREGSALRDYFEPSFVVIGEMDAHSGLTTQGLYAAVQAPIIRTSLKKAEIVKYACNAFHALKIVFANEIGNICKLHGIDGQEVMKIFASDKQLNISPAYLRPGYAFGGSCLPKDVKALTYRAKEIDADCAVLNAILPSNKNQIALAIRMVERTKHKRIGILGLSFKADTDDLRESPAITLAETLIGRGYQVRIFDDQVQLSRLVGANKAFIEKEIPHITSLMCSDLKQLVDASDVVVITNGSKTFEHAVEFMRSDQVVIDLVGEFKGNPKLAASYQGIAW